MWFAHNTKKMMMTVAIMMALVLFVLYLIRLYALFLKFVMESSASVDFFCLPGYFLHMHYWFLCLTRLSYFCLLQFCSKYNKLLSYCQVPSWICCNLEGNGKDSSNDDFISSSVEMDVYETTMQENDRNVSYNGESLEFPLIFSFKAILIQILPFQLCSVCDYYLYVKLNILA